MVFKSKAISLLLVAILFSSVAHPMSMHVYRNGTVKLLDENKSRLPKRIYECALALYCVGALVGLGIADKLRMSAISGCCSILAGTALGALSGYCIDKAVEKPTESNDYYKHTNGHNIFWAAAKGFVSALQTHIDAGINPFTKDQDGRTPLMYAAAHGSYSTVKRLLEYAKKSEHNWVDNDGNTALLLAAKAKQPEIAKLLIAHSANFSISDKNGVTVLSLIQSGYLQGINENDLVYPQYVSIRENESVPELETSGISG